MEKIKKKIAFEFYFISDKDSDPLNAYLMINIENKKRVLDTHYGSVTPAWLGPPDYDFEYAKHDLFYGRPLIKESLEKAGYDVSVNNKEIKIKVGTDKHEKLYAHLKQAEDEDRFNDINNIIKYYKVGKRKLNKEYL